MFSVLVKTREKRFLKISVLDGRTVGLTVEISLRLWHFFGSVWQPQLLNIVVDGAKETHGYLSAQPPFSKFTVNSFDTCASDKGSVD